MENRLQRLEASIRSQRRCPVCGLRPDEWGYQVVSYPEEEKQATRDEAPHIPEVCPECGRDTKTHIVVTYEDDPGEGSC